MPGPETALHGHASMIDGVSRGSNHPVRNEAIDLNDAIARIFAALINVDVVGDEALHLEHRNGQRGLMTADDILDGCLRVVDARTREVSTYEHIAALIAAGWSVDW